MLRSRLYNYFRGIRREETRKTRHAPVVSAIAVDAELDRAYKVCKAIKQIIACVYNEHLQAIDRSLQSRATTGLLVNIRAISWAIFCQ